MALTAEQLDARRARIAELDAEIAQECAIRDRAEYRSRDWWCAERRLRALASVRATLWEGQTSGRVVTADESPCVARSPRPAEGPGGPGSSQHAAPAPASNPHDLGGAGAVGAACREDR